MGSEKVLAAMNTQINKELYSSYLYLAMAAYLENTGFPGMANWMQIQAREELSHAMKFYHYIIERGGRIVLSGIDSPPTEWKTPQEVFAETLAHEKKVTGMINDLMSLAIAEKDYASTSFLQWFIDEQVEEEASASEILKKVTIVGDSGQGIFMLDTELGQRVFTPPEENK